jgi:hypothetical protein
MPQQWVNQLQLHNNDPAQEQCADCQTHSSLSFRKRFRSEPDLIALRSAKTRNSKVLVTIW